mgnify:CR=1 FL=1
MHRPVGRRRCLDEGTERVGRQPPAAGEQSAADGYHTLESLFALVDFADTLTLSMRADGPSIDHATVNRDDLEASPASPELSVAAYGS